MKLPTVSINKDILKIIALITMTIDHIGQYLSYIPFADASRYIGRISFPIFAFLLMEHLYKKQIFKKYIIRLSVFGGLTMLLLCPFHGLIDGTTIYPLNILFTFLNAILFLLCYEWINNEPVKHWMKIVAQMFNFICYGAISCACQYGIMGFCYLIMIYFYFRYPTYVRYILILILSIQINTDHYWWIVSLLTTLCLLQATSNNNQKRYIKPWWVFYLYYPLHLFILATISYCCK